MSLHPKKSSQVVKNSKILNWDLYPQQNEFFLMISELSPGRAILISQIEAVDSN